MRTHNVKFEQKIANGEYVNHLYEIFKDFVGTPSSVREIRGGGVKDRQSLWFRTYRHQCFTDYYNLFYKDGVKIVPFDIENMLTARSLAYWFMDDGSKQGNSGYTLHTYAFTWEDQERLKIILETKFGLKISLHLDEKHKRVYVWAESVDKFNSLIIPYMHPCFLYKLHR